MRSSQTLMLPPLVSCHRRYALLSFATLSEGDPIGVTSMGGCDDMAGRAPRAGAIVPHALPRGHVPRPRPAGARSRLTPRGRSGNVFQSRIQTGTDLSRCRAAMVPAAPVMTTACEPPLPPGARGRGG